jgi:hypothetical protein
MRSLWYVYWLYDDTCTRRDRHGCIGAIRATQLYRRLHQYRQSRRIPKEFRYRIIFRGSQKQAYALEAKLRPRPYIGWNIGVGGFANGGGLKGIPKSPEQRAKQSAAAKARWADPAARKAQSKAVRKALKHVDRNGANNANYGKVTSEAAKQKMREKIAERGGVSGKNNPNYRHSRYVE